MKDTMFRRVIASALALALCASASVPAFADSEAADDSTLGTQATADDSATGDGSSAATTGTDSIRQTSYTNYVKKYTDAARPDKTVEVLGKDYDPASVTDAQITVTTVDGENDVMQWANQEGSDSWTVNIPETGVYNIKMIYEALESNTNDVEFSLLIDGESPYATASRITLSKRWINESEIKQDSRQNDIRPGQISTPCWQETPLEDIDGLFNEPLEFYMEAGEHTITFESEKAEFAVKSFTFYQYEAPAAYTAPSDSDLTQAQGQKITLEGETAAYKSSRTLYPTADKSSYLTSSANGSSPTKTRYNTIGSGSWTQSTQTVTWEFNVDKAGYYKIGIRGRQDQMRGMYSNRRLYVNGEVPCLEANQIKFYYDTDWSITTPKSENGDDLYFYLQAGTNTISLEAVPGEIGEIMGNLDELVYNINSYYRQIRQITGPDPDEYNNYMIDTAIPSIVPDFKEYAQTLRDKKAEIEKHVTIPGYEDVEAGIVKWPLSVLRIRSKDEKRLIDLATHVLENWRGYTDEAAFVFAETDGEPHNTITPIARKVGDTFELDLTLRNNITTEENPLGVYHPHACYHHIKKENIGLIEVMGLAVLPARLKEELELLEEYILSGKDIASNEKIEKHAAWVAEFLPKYEKLDKDNIQDVLRKEVGNVFVHVLEDAGVYKCTPEGRDAFMRFISTL